MNSTVLLSFAWNGKMLGVMYVGFDELRHLDRGRNLESLNIDNTVQTKREYLWDSVLTFIF